jgi:CRP/FNR family transcriptional regulator, cyclic AMP receptor protein
MFGEGLPAMAGVALLKVDGQLGRGLAEGERELAERALVAPAMRLPVGPWDPAPLAHHGRSALGLVLVAGTVSQTLTMVGRSTSHLFGPGDVLRPWADSAVDAPGLSDSSWTVLSPSVVALFDRRLIAMAARWPSVLVELSVRASRQVNRVALQVAIARIPRIDDRLLVLFWRIAQRWGRVTPEGVLIQLPLTHEAIASLVAASRPPVSTALAALSREGLLRRTREGWLLDRDVEARLAAELEPDGESAPAAAG